MQILRTPGAYKQFQAGSGVRSTYRVNGVIADIRFRRQLQVKNVDTVEIPVVDPVTNEPTGTTTTSPNPNQKKDIGYVGLK